MKMSTASMPTDGRLHARTNRIGAQRRADCSLFEILDARRQRARTQRHRKILRLLIGEAAIDDALYREWPP